MKKILSATIVGAFFLLSNPANAADLKGMPSLIDKADLYVYGLPVCSECAKGVIQVGIKRVIMCHPTNIDERWRDSFADTEQMFSEAGLSVQKYSTKDISSWD